MESEFKAARLAAGLTQKQVTELMDIPRRTLQDWEAGKNIPPVYVRRWYLQELATIAAQTTDRK